MVMMNKKILVLCIALFAVVLCQYGIGQEKPRPMISIPILAYHRFSTDLTVKKESSVIDTQPEKFASEMQYLKDNGYEAVSMDIFLKENLKKPLPAKPVIICFDDGWKSAYSVAFPVLKKLGFTANLFLVTSCIGAPAFLDWPQCREMAAAGFTICSHSITHAHLTRFLDKEKPADYIKRIRFELEDSKRVLEKQLGNPVRHFAYPYGDYTEAVAFLAKQAGYETLDLATDGVNPYPADPSRIYRFMASKQEGPKTLKRWLNYLPLAINSPQPGDGSVIHSRDPHFSAVIDPQAFPADVTIVGRLGEVSYPCSFDPQKGLVAWRVPFHLRMGLHVASVNVTDLQTGKIYRGAWTFAVKSRVDCDKYQLVKNLLNLP